VKKGQKSSDDVRPMYGYARWNLQPPNCVGYAKQESR
jgi:hypothetical protein